MNDSITSSRKVRRQNFIELEKFKSITDCLRGVPSRKLDNGYSFKQYLFGEESPAVTFDLMHEFRIFVADCFSEITIPDAILSPEPNGIIWGTIASLELCKPSIYARLVDDKPELTTITNGYCSKVLDIGLTGTSQSIALVDDVISTGATLKSIKNQVEIAGFVVSSVIALHSHIDATSFSEDLSVPVFTLSDCVQLER